MSGDFLSLVAFEGCADVGMVVVAEEPLSFEFADGVRDLPGVDIAGYIQASHLVIRRVEISEHLAAVEPLEYLPVILVEDGRVPQPPRIFIKVSTLLITVGLPHNPLVVGNGGLCFGCPLSPSIEAIIAVSSPQT